MTDPDPLERALTRALNGTNGTDEIARAIQAGLRTNPAEDTPALNDPALERSLLAALDNSTAREDTTP